MLRFRDASLDTRKEPNGNIKSVTQNIKKCLATTIMAHLMGVKSKDVHIQEHCEQDTKKWKWMSCFCPRAYYVHHLLNSYKNRAKSHPYVLHLKYTVFKY